MATLDRQIRPTRERRHRRPHRRADTQLARERGIQSRFAWGFAIAGLGWLIGMMLGVYSHKPLSP